MWKLLQLLFIGHVHDWQIKSEVDICIKNWHYDDYGRVSGDGEILKIGKHYHMQCKTCGTLKSIKLRIE